MTQRERFRNVMDFKSVDMVPNYELGYWGQTYDRWVAEGMPGASVYGNWFEGEPYLHIDRRAFAGLDRWMHPGFDYEVLEEDERYLTARHANGIVTRALKEGTAHDGTRMSMDQYLSHPVTNRASFAEIKKRYDSDVPTRYPLWWDEWARIWRTRDYPLCLLTNGRFGLYSQLRSWAGTEGISYLFYDDPALVEEMIEFNTEFLLAVVERALREVEFDYFNFHEDFAGKGGPLISPAIFQRFFMPSYERIIERFRKAGITSFWLDSDGNCEPLIPLMIGVGITCLWPLEQAADMDPVRLRKEYGKDLTLVGGIDKREIAKDRKAIKAELNAKIPPLLESGGFLPHLDHTFPPDISYENLLYYLEMKTRMLGMDVQNALAQQTAVARQPAAQSQPGAQTRVDTPRVHCYDSEAGTASLQAIKPRRCAWPHSRHETVGPTYGC